MHTMDQIFDRYVDERLPRLRARTRVDYGRHIARLRHSFGHRVAKELTLPELNTFMDVDTGKIQRNRIMAVLSAALGAAVKWRWIDFNICKEVERHKSKARDRLVSDKEIEGVQECL